MQLERKGSIFKGKLIFTMLILLIYMTGRYIPLYGIDTQAYADSAVGAEDILMQVIGGDTYQHSLFALGIFPHIIATLIVQIVMLCMGTERREKVSPRKMNWITLFLTLVLALLQAISSAEGLMFGVERENLYFAKLIAMLEMMTGAMVVLKLANMNKKYGIGGQTILIIFNIATGIAVNVKGHIPGNLVIPILISAAVMLVILVMENMERRLPLQRVSIHNIYANKNYMAIKYNPIGVMPVMFSTAFFMLPQLIINLLCLLFPANLVLIWWQDNLNLGTPLGIMIYIIIVYMLTIGFSFIFINPKDTVEQFLKNGDSIINVHAGRDTKKYLRKQVFQISFFSATVMSVCLGVPLILQLRGNIDGNLAMLPSSAMMMAGMLCNFGREGVAVRSYDAYRRFSFM